MWCFIVEVSFTNLLREFFFNFYLLRKSKARFYKELNLKPYFIKSLFQLHFQKNVLINLKIDMQITLLCTLPQKTQN